MSGGGASGGASKRMLAGALAGTLAAELAGELAAPMQALRDRLALLVDHIDRYISHSTGPTPYPWQALQGLRHDLGGAYLEATLLVRQLGDVQTVLMVPPSAGRDDGEGGWTGVDCAHEVEVALNLLAMKHGHAELIADVGATPPVVAQPGALALVITRLLWLCAQSVHGVSGAAISLRTWAEASAADDAGVAERDPGGAGAVVISIADSGHGLPQAAEETAALLGLVESLVAAWRGALDAVVTPERGCSFELRLLPAARTT